MSKRNLQLWAAAVVLVSAAVAGVVTFDQWRGWIFSDAATKVEDHHAAHDTAVRVTLTEQAKRNLGLVLAPVTPSTFSRTIPMPGSVVEQPGRTDRGIVAPVSGIVLSVATGPNKTVRPGDEVLTLRLLSDSLQTSQTELFKTVRELELIKIQRELLEKSVREGAVPQAKLLELDYQKERFKALQQAHQQDLLARGLTEKQLIGVESGSFVTEMKIKVPARAKGGVQSKDTQLKGAADSEATEYEVHELKVNVGDYVQAGQLLAYLADHRLLYLEGHSFKEQVGLVVKALEQGWPVTAEIAEQGDSVWTALPPDLKISYLGTTAGPTGLTVPFYVPLANQTYEFATGKSGRVWRFRPGQRVLMHVTVAKIPDVLVLPREAVVREGAEHYVFRWNGRNKKEELLLERLPVHVRYEDNTHAVLANDGSIPDGAYIAHNNAAALNRALKAQQSSGAADPHAGHSH